MTISTLKKIIGSIVSTTIEDSIKSIFTASNLQAPLSKQDKIGLITFQLARMTQETAITSQSKA
jgi:hypothetical protein